MAKFKTFDKIWRLEGGAAGNPGKLRAVSPPSLTIQLLEFQRLDAESVILVMIRLGFALIREEPSSIDFRYTGAPADAGTIWFRKLGGAFALKDVETNYRNWTPLYEYFDWAGSVP